VRETCSRDVTIANAPTSRDHTISLVLLLHFLLFVHPLIRMTLQRILRLFARAFSRSFDSSRFSSFYRASRYWRKMSTVFFRDMQKMIGIRKQFYCWKMSFSNSLEKLFRFSTIFFNKKTRIICYLYVYNNILW